nr:MAG TPA: zinc-ribbon containing domain protein [Caudoviricetes sp.]
MVLTMAEYIDKEAFKKSVEERYCKPCKAEKKDHNGCWCRACWVDDMLDEVECFQIADVAPVVHGRWIHDGQRINGGIDWCHCSECGKSDNFCARTNYCPNCGAKMDEKEAVYD